MKNAHLVLNRFLFYTVSSLNGYIQALHSLQLGPLASMPTERTMRFLPLAFQ
jgi:hypothetical protein